MSSIVPAPADGYAGDLTPEQAWELLTTDPGAVLVDVRTRGEWEHIGVPDPAGATGRPAIFTQWVLGDGRPNPAFLAELGAGLGGVLAQGDDGVGRAQGGDGEALGGIRAQGGDAGRAKLVFLCRSGQRSVAAARVATAAGHAPSYNVLEGFEGAPGPSGRRDVEGWKVAGLPWRPTFADGAPAGETRGERGGVGPVRAGAGAGRGGEGLADGAPAGEARGAGA